MEKRRNRETTYVQKVQQDTRHYIQSLLSENEALRSLLGELESEKAILEKQFILARKQLDLHKGEQARLKQRLSRIETDRHLYANRYEEIEQLNSNLANLYVTSYQLHGTLDREEVLAIIQEIIINLVGCEEVAIFEPDSGGALNLLMASFDIDKKRYGRIPIGSGIIGHVAETAEPYFKGGNGDDSATTEEDDLTACIALNVKGKLLGAIAIFALLPQKQGLEELDHELFGLLATHASTALYCAGLHSRRCEAVGSSARSGDG